MPRRKGFKKVTFYKALKQPQGIIPSTMVTRSQKKSDPFYAQTKDMLKQSAGWGRHVAGRFQTIK